MSEYISRVTAMMDKELQWVEYFNPITKNNSTIIFE
jgi:hypothetical protein